MKKFFLVILLIVSFGSERLFADAPKDSSVTGIFKSEEDFNYPDYYQVKDDPRLQNINLLVLEHYSEKFPLPTIPYNRATDFGGWLRDTSGETCLNTRGKALVRDSSTSVTYSADGCTVQGGDWNDPYTANVYVSAKDIQIDHVVPLKNAYMSGAYEWDFKKRCLYANYLGNAFHLLSVNGKENMKKSDSSPSGYIPPNKSYTCQYIKEWLNIKLIWSLRLTPKESDAINKAVADNNCDPQAFVIPSGDLTEQRKFMADHADLCASPALILESF